MIWTWLWWQCPTWVVGLLLVMLMTGIFWLAQRLCVSPPEDPEKDTSVVSAVIGLFALLLAFTFGMGLERYNIRRDLVLQEANALGTSYLRARLLKDADRKTLTHSLFCYGQVRLSFFEAREDAHLLSRAYEQTDVWQSRIWNQLSVVSQKAPPSDAILSRLLDSLNELFDLALSRQIALESRIPPLVLEVLTWVSLLSAFMMGYYQKHSSSNQKMRVFLMFLVMGLVMMLILDLDRPRSGWITVSQAPLNFTLEDIQKSGQLSNVCQADASK
ncbi:MAG: hypothetical protein VKK59_00390 [Vampirovibrionales bacterium]|nr:hypothetical protein [Vampirovibrionales bacterium]